MDLSDAFADSIAKIIIGAFIVGAVVALGGYFGISWLIEHVSISVK